MAKFFTSPQDVVRWVKETNKTPTDAVQRVAAILQDDQHHQDITESIENIFEETNPEHAGQVLYNIFTQYHITEQDVAAVSKKVEAMNKSNLTKQAQIMRQPGQYPMELRVCPKLPYSVGKRLISTYNCRHYCLDSITLDDNPNAVYCAEALWRKHVMDKFSREWMDAKNGEYVGGYVNNRFHVFPTAGTPDNPDVPRDQGQRMSLAPWERTRKPNEDEYSTERRLQEQREKGSTESIQLTASDYESSIGQALIKQGSSKGFIRIASSEIKNAKDSEIYSVFAESIELVAQGISDDKAIVQLSDKYNMPIPRVYAIRQLAMRKMAAHSSDVYQVVKTAAGIGEPAATGYGSIIGGEEVMPGPAQAKKLWITKNVTAINMDDQKIELTPSTELYPIGNMTPEGMQVYNVTDRRNNNQYQVKVNTMTDEWKRSISPVDPAEADFQFKAEQGAETIQGQGQQEMASRAPIAKGVY